MDNLVWVGGCDAFGLTRRELLWQVGLWLPPTNGRSDPARSRKQLELPLEHPYETLRFGDLTVDEKLLAEYEMLGYAPSGHPLALLRGRLPRQVVGSDRLPHLQHGSAVEVAGLVVARQRPQTAKGFVFLLIEDEASMINVIVRPDIFDRDRVAVRAEPFVWILGQLAKDDGSLNVIAEEVRPLRIRTPAVAVSDSPAPSRYSLLRTLRQLAPGSKDWG